MRPFYFAPVALAAVLLAYGCGGSDDTNTTASTASGGASSTPAGGGGAGGEGGAGANHGGGGKGGGGAASGGGSASGGSNAGGGSASGGGNTGGNGNTGGAGGGGPECTTGHDTCPSGKYCEAPGCGAGHCRNKPSAGMMSNAESLVCGCDGVTYWNAHVAAENGQSVDTTGKCPGASGPPCSLMNGCAGGLTCNIQVDDKASCSPLAEGVCWGLPIQCPTHGPKAKACTDDACSDHCSLIASGHSWYDDGNCP